MATSVVGLDIGTSSVRAVELQDADKAKPSVLRFDEVALPPGAVHGGEVVEPNTVATSLKRLWSQAGFRSKDVVLGMGNQRVLVRELSVPRMSIDRIRESLPFLVQELLPVPVADAVLDFYPVEEQDGESGPLVSGLLVAAVKEAVLANVRAAQLAGLTPVAVDLLPFALSRAIGTGARGITALVDIGAATTNVLILQNGVPQFARIIPAGGDDLTSALAGQLDISREDADRIKRTLGLASSKQLPDAHRPAVEVIYAVTSELLGGIRNTISYFTNQRELTAIDQIVLSGGGAQLPGFARALSELTLVPVVDGDPFAGVNRPKGTRSDADRSMAVALGLALGSAA